MVPLQLTDVVSIAPVFPRLGMAGREGSFGNGCRPKIRARPRVYLLPAPDPGVLEVESTTNVLLSSPAASRGPHRALYLLCSVPFPPKGILFPVGRGRR